MRNNIPVFFIHDSKNFPDLIHAAMPEPHREIPQVATAHDTFWDFVSLMPASTHMLFWIRSDLSIPRSLRMMERFGVHPFRLVNDEGKGTFPEWDLGMQLVPEADESKCPFDLLDPTKLIPEELVPIRRVGTLTLNRNPDNYFEEIEQVVFHPGS